MENTPKKQQITGLVVSDAMDKTVVVEVHTRKRHPKYHKNYTVTSKHKAHDENNEYHKGDQVVIESIAPKSKDKTFAVIKKA